MQNEGVVSIFSGRYWRLAGAEIKNLRSLTFASLCIALIIVTSLFFIPIGQNLHIEFTFLATALGSMVYGPVVGIFTGMISDILGYIISPSGVFFPGYTLTDILVAVIYALFLYRSRITVLRITIAKLIVNYAINVALGSLWSAMLYGKGYLYYFAKSIVKNTLMLPIEIVLLVVFLQLLMPLLTRLNIIPQQKGNRISFI